MNTQRHAKTTHQVKVGHLAIGGNAPISVQSMTNTDTHDFSATLSQVLALQAAGCDIVRLAVPTREAAPVFAFLKEAGVKVPLVADIHFDYKIALDAIAAGADKIRINPGNIGEEAYVKAVVKAASEKNIPIRIGVNAGSLEKHLLEKYGAPTPEALAESAMGHVRILEALDFHDIVLSVKSSHVPTMIATNRLLRDMTPYPIHLGVTEAGNKARGSIKSAIGVGALLADGIGDTVRVSLTADPVEEIGAAKNILSALGIKGQSGMNIVSCPTCGRTKIDLIELSARFEKAAGEAGLLELPIRVALMGCAVNGPGEAREADIGICGGVGEALLIAHGEIIEKIPEDQVIERLITEIKKLSKK